MTVLVDFTGSVFDSTASAFAHGCNTRGVMSAGVAAAFKERWPDMYVAYRKRCREGQFRLGDVFAWTDPGSGTVIYNLATQVEPGRDGRILAVAETVNAMCSHAAAAGLNRVAIPRIGCGIAGLAWDGGVRNVISETACRYPVTIEVWTPAQ